MHMLYNAMPARCKLSMHGTDVYIMLVVINDDCVIRIDQAIR
jgi:hypothetical protein